jgi:hypothetical protein
VVAIRIAPDLAWSTQGLRARSSPPDPLASHSSRSNSREFALALDCLALAMAYAAHARLQSFSVQLALGVSK